MHLSRTSYRDGTAMCAFGFRGATFAACGRIIESLSDKKLFTQNLVVILLPELHECYEKYNPSHPRRLFATYHKAGIAF